MGKHNDGTSTTYSIVIYGGLLLTALPAIWSWSYSGVVDGYPSAICLGCGLVVSVVLGLRRYRAQERALLRKIQEKQKKRKQGNEDHDRPSEAASSTDVQGGRAVTWLLLLLGPPCWCLTLGLLGNRLLDSAEPIEHTVSVVKIKKKTKGGDIIYLTSWRDGEEAWTVRSGRIPGVHRGVARGTRVALWTKPGAFGWEWIVSAARK